MARLSKDTPSLQENICLQTLTSVKEICAGASDSRVFKVGDKAAFE